MACIVILLDGAAKDTRNTLDPRPILTNSHFYFPQQRGAISLLLCYFHISK